MNTDALRQRYLMIGVEALPDSKLAREYGCGHRVFFLAASNGEWLVLLDSVGSRVRVARRDVSLAKVYSSAGKAIPFELDKDTGHILAFIGVRKDKDGDYEEWKDMAPWAKHDPAFNSAIRR